MDIALSARDATTPQATAHLLPCKIHASGNRDATGYFRPWTTEAEQGREHVFFRGRKLEAETVALAEGFHGWVFRPEPEGDAQRLTAGDDRRSDTNGPTWRARYRFDSIKLWHHGRQSSCGGVGWERSLNQWLDLSGAIHADDKDEGRA